MPSIFDDSSLNPQTSQSIFDTTNTQSDNWVAPIGLEEAGFNASMGMIYEGINAVSEAAGVEPLEWVVEQADKHNELASYANPEDIVDKLRFAVGQLGAPFVGLAAGAALAPLVGATAMAGGTVGSLLTAYGMTLGELEQKKDELAKATGIEAPEANVEELLWSGLLTAPDLFAIGRAKTLLAPIAEVAEEAVKGTMRTARGVSGITGQLATDSVKTGLAEGVQDLGTGLGANYFTGTEVDESRIKALTSSFVDEAIIGTILGVPLSGASMATAKLGEAQAAYDQNRKLALEEERMAQAAWEEEIDPSTGLPFPDRQGRNRLDLQDFEGNISPELLDEEGGVVNYVPIEGAAKQPGFFSPFYNVLTGNATDGLRTKFWDNQAMQLLTSQFNVSKEERHRGLNSITENGQIDFGQYNRVSEDFFNATPADQQAAWEARAKGLELDTPAKRSLDASLGEFVPNLIRKASRGKLGNEGLFLESTYLPIHLSIDWKKIAEDSANAVATMQAKMREKGKSEGQIEKATNILQKRIEMYNKFGNDYHYGVDRRTDGIESVVKKLAEEGRSAKATKSLLAYLRRQREQQKKESHLTLDRALEDVPQEWFEGYRNGRTPYEIMKIHGKLSTEHAALINRFGPNLELFDELLAKAIVEGQAKGNPLSGRDIEKAYDVLRTQQRIHLRPIDKKMRERQQKARATITTIVLGQSALVSIPESLSVALNTDMRSALKALSATIGRNKANYVASNDIGLALTDALHHVVNRTGEEAFEIPKLESQFIQQMTGPIPFGKFIQDKTGLPVDASLPKLQYFLTTWAAKANDIHIRRMLEELASPDISTTKRNRNYNMLAEAGIDPQKADNLRISGYDKNHPYYKDYVGSIGALVADTIVDPHPIDKPLWMNDERFLLISQLKGFMVAFTNRVMKGNKDRLGMQSANKNIAARETVLRIAPYVAAYLVGQVGVGYMKDYIRSGEPNDEKDVAARVATAVGYLGSVGYFVDPINAAMHGSDPLSAGAGPAYSLANNTIKGSVAAIGALDPEVTLFKTLMRLVPNVPGKGYVTDLFEEAFGQ